MFIWVSTASKLHNNDKKRVGRPPSYGETKALVALHVRVPEKVKVWLKRQVDNTVFSSYGHGVTYCVKIMMNVFEMREKQILDLAKSADMGKTLNNIDDMISKGEQRGREKAE